MFVNMARANSRVEQGEETVARLIEVAFSLFSEHGYHAVAAETVVERAGVTRGALYHHFDGKQGLFEAVFIECEKRIAARIEQAARRKREPVAQLIAGSLAFLEACADAGLRRVVIEDGPAVLGWPAWRRIDAEHGFALLRGAILRLEADRRLRGYSSEALAYLLSGAMNELAMWVAESPRPPAALAAAKKTLNALLRRAID